METPTHDEEPAKSVVLHDFGYEKVSVQYFLDGICSLTIVEVSVPSLST